MTILGNWQYDVYACIDYPNSLDCTSPLTVTLEVKDPCLEPSKSIDGTQHIFDENKLKTHCGGHNPLCASPPCASPRASPPTFDGNWADHNDV